MARNRFTVRTALGTAGLLGLGMGLAAAAPAPQVKDAGKGQPPAKATQKAGVVDQTRQVVPMTTADGVELVGTFYRGLKGKDSPCVILLHKYGSDRSQGDWDVLAKALQGSRHGFAVLSFDFRGHGESKSVNPTFWNFQANKQQVNAGRDKTRIEFKDFKPAYLPWLINDIATARKFLEVKNDGGELNVNSLFLIGAQEGASLGMLFAASEWTRTYTTGFKALQSVGTRHNAGQDIAGCSWLTLAQRPNNINFEINTWLKLSPQLRDQTPTLFLFGEQDNTGKQTADNVFRLMTSGKEKNKFTQKADVKGTQLAGQALLGQASLGVTARILEFTDRVLTERKAIPWGTVAHDENPLQAISVNRFGFNRLP